MAEKGFSDALNEQIGNEFAASQQYIAAAVYYEEQTLPQLAGFFYRQAVEERNHAMIMVQHLLDTGQEIRIPAVEAPSVEFSDIVAPVKMALEQEKRVTEEINDLFELARSGKDYQGEQFLQWFVKEQIEEVRTMEDLLRNCERETSELEIEEYVARELAGAEDDPTTPPAAGGAL